MVAVQVYFPDAQYSHTSKAESYSQLLGAKAAVVTQGTPAGRWRLGMAPPKPDSAQLQHPRRLLMADLETHLVHYRAASKLSTVTFDVRDHVVAASWCGPDRHHLRRAASPTPHFKRRGRASVELDGTRSCSCCEVRLSALTRR